MAVYTRVYRGDSSGGPVDYSTPIDDVAGPPWTTPDPLDPGDVVRFGLRNHDTVSGLDDGATDSEVEVVVAADGSDASGRPAPVSGLRASWIAPDSVRVEWSYLAPGIYPDAFLVRATLGTVPDLGASPLAFVPYRKGWVGYVAVLTGLSAATRAVSVRARDADGLEDGSEAFVLVSPDASAPAAVESLTATLVAEEP